MGTQDFSGRLDFELEMISFDDVTGKFEFRIIPRTDRYEWKTVNGRKLLFDKMDNVLFPENFMQQVKDEIRNLPFFFEKSEIKDIDKYIVSRIPEIGKRIKDDKDGEELIDKSAEFLDSLSMNKLEFVILSIDIKDSSMLSNQLSGEDFSLIITNFLWEISAVVPLYHGYVLKYTGDGLIAYFPAPSFIIKNDLALECGLVMRKIVYLGLNKVFEETKLPKIDIRIGIDSGSAYIRVLGNPATKRHHDIIGEVINLSTKIQGIAEAGGISIGEETFRNLYTPFRKRFVEQKLPSDWKYKDNESSLYKVFQIDFKT